MMTIENKDMQTELTDIKKWTDTYLNPPSVEAWKDAYEKLKKVHDKYGTIEISIIKSLIN